MKYLICLFFLMGIAKVSAQEQFSVYFDSNKFALKKTELKRLNDWIAQNQDSKVLGAYGFCDEVGSVGYNDTLAQKRVDYVFGKINGKVKIREDFKSISFGELHNMSKIQAENRKVTLYYLLAKDLDKETDILKKRNNAPVEEIKPKPIVKYPSELNFENPDGSKITFKLDTIFMKKVASAPKGEKLKLENLNFVINTFAVTNESRPKLYELLYVMQKNPNLKIEIQGHLCCNPTDKQNLSTQRAKAVYNFLIMNEIDKSRLSYKGFGSSQPIYPLPEKNEHERAMNRRVEILIVEN